MTQSPQNASHCSLGTHKNIRHRDVGTNRACFPTNPPVSESGERGSDCVLPLPSEVVRQPATTLTFSANMMTGSCQYDILHGWAGPWGAGGVKTLLRNCSLHSVKQLDVTEAGRRRRACVVPPSHLYRFHLHVNELCVSLFCTETKTNAETHSAADWEDEQGRDWCTQSAPTSRGFDFTFRVRPDDPAGNICGKWEGPEPAIRALRSRRSRSVNSCDQTERTAASTLTRSAAVLSVVVQTAPTDTKTLSRLESTETETRPRL